MVNTFPDTGWPKWTNNVPHEKQRNNLPQCCDDCLVVTPSRPNIHNTDLPSSRSAPQHNLAIVQLLNPVACRATASQGGRRSDRPAPEETPGAPFAFKDSMIH